MNQQSEEFFFRAQMSIMDAFDKGQFGYITRHDFSRWRDCEAKEVAEYLSEIDAQNVHSVWYDFPGGWTRFLDMRDRIRSEAQREKGDSTIDWIPCVIAGKFLEVEQ